MEKWGKEWQCGTEKKIMKPIREEADKGKLKFDN